MPARASSLGLSITAEQERLYQWLRPATEVAPTGQVMAAYAPQGELWVAVMPGWTMRPARYPPGEVETRDAILGVVRGAWDGLNGVMVWPEVLPGDVLERGGTKWEVLYVEQLENVGLLLLGLRQVEGA